MNPPVNPKNANASGTSVPRVSVQARAAGTNGAPDLGRNIKLAIMGAAVVVISNELDSE